MQKTHTRALTYWTLGLSLAVLGWVCVRSAWRGTTELHTLMELIATLVACGVGGVALLRHHARPHNAFLFLAAGFLGTALLDGYHAVVTSIVFDELWPSPPESLLPWTWSASRTYLGGVLLLHWWARSRARFKSPGWVTLWVCALTLGCFAFFALVPLPRAYYPELVLARPQELLPAALFAGALGGHLREGRWREDQSEYWLVLSLILGLLVQVPFMCRSSALFDASFDLAHLLKTCSYACVGVGLALEMHGLFRLAERSGEDLRQLIESCPVAVVAVDMSGVVVLVNQEIERMFGYGREELVGRPIEVLVPEAIHEAHVGLRDAYLAQPSARPMGSGRDLYAYSRDGRRMDIELGLRPLPTPAGTWILAAVVDVTARREAEQQLADMNSLLEAQVAARTGELQQANADLEQFVYAASHDLRAPLRAVDNLSSWLLEDLGPSLAGENKENLRLLRQRVCRMERLLDDLLAYSRAGRRSHPAERIDTQVLVQEIVEMLSPPEGFTVQADSDLPVLYGQKPPLEQVLQNLISNALKHHPGPSGRVVVSAEERGEFYEFRVQDDGSGIASEYHERIFSMFQTLASRDEKDSSGIGLALVERHVRAQGGEIRIDSAPGEGTTMRFSWPKATRPVEVMSESR